MNTDYKEQLNNLRNKLLKLWPSGDDVLKEEAWNAWENSLYMIGLDFIEDINSQFIKKTADGVQLAFTTIDQAGNIIDQDDGEYIQPQYKEPKRNKIGKETKFNPEAENITAKEQAVIYYFIANPGEDPTAQKTTDDNIKGIVNAFIKLDSYYFEISEHNEKPIDITEEFYNFLDLSKPKKKYRTRANAIEKGAIDNLPNYLATPTHKDYKNSISFYNDGKNTAHLAQLMDNIEVKFSDGTLYVDGQNGKAFKANLKDMTTDENIEEIDLPTLGVFFTMVKHQFQAGNYTELKETVKISVPDLAEYMGLPRNINRERTEDLINKVKSYHHIIGVIPNDGQNRRKNPLPDLTTVLIFHNYYEKDNIIEFSSPYFNRIIESIFNVTVKRDSKNQIIYDNSGTPLFKDPGYSHLIKPSITKARDKAAIGNVILIVQGIEMAGGKSYHISIQTLIDRNINLAKALEDPTHQARVLKRVFKNTWRLLRDETILNSKYENIKLPDPDNPADLPTIRDMKNNKVFTITHNGKKRETPNKKSKITK